MPYKKLIETVMPVSIINSETEREKNTRSGLPSSIHIWWTRQSMAVTRSVLFALLVDDPGEHPEMYPTIEKQNRERNRLVELTAALSVVENISNNNLLEEAKKEIRRYSDRPIPPVFDPFVGGGSTPVEVHRLGLNALSSDLNAVAAMITTVVSDIPARFANIGAVHPQENKIFDLQSPGMQGFADDVKYYGEWMQKEALKKLCHLYPKVSVPDTGKEVDAVAWVWARTVKCPNPTCGCNIPLSSSYDLARKKGAEVWVEPVVEDGTVRFRIHMGPHTVKKGKPKVGQTAVFKCPVCGEITTDAYVKECGVNHQISSQLIALVVDDGKNRLYIEPDTGQTIAANVQPPKNIPHGALPDFPKRFSPPSFGLTDYADLFTNRQLVYLTTMLKLASKVQTAVEKQAVKNGLNDDDISFSDGGNGALAYAQAVRTVLVLTVSKLLDRCSNICSWNASSGGSLRNVFSRAAMPMIWDYAEGNPFASASGSFLKTLERVCEAISVLPAGIAGRTWAADGTIHSEIHNVIISTDLPYYERCSYSDLSDFFYVWLKYGLEDIYPKYFKEKLSAKKEELTAFAYRWNGDKSQANAFYAEGLNLALKNIADSATEDYPSAISYIYKQNTVNETDTLSEWELFITAIHNAELSVTASWPLGKKLKDDIEPAEKSGSPITIIVRRKPGDAPVITRRSFVTMVKRETPLIIEELKEKVTIGDLRASKHIYS